MLEPWLLEPCPWLLEPGRSAEKRLAFERQRFFPIQTQALAFLRREATIFEDLEGPAQCTFTGAVTVAGTSVSIVIFENSRREWLVIERRGRGWFVAPAAPLGRGRLSPLFSPDKLRPLYEQGLAWVRKLKDGLQANPLNEADLSVEAAGVAVRSRVPGTLLGVAAQAGELKITYLGKVVDITFADFASGDFDAAKLARTLLAIPFSDPTETRVSDEQVRKALQKAKRRTTATAAGTSSKAG